MDPSRDGTASPGPGETPAGPPTAPSAAPRGAPVAPLALPMLRIVEAGLVLWVVALALTLAVPALRTGDRGWWPWCCVAGLALGALGWVYLRRGRGNAAGA